MVFRSVWLLTRHAEDVGETKECSLASDSGNRTVPVAVVYGDSGDTCSRDAATGFWSITSGSDHVSTTYDVLGRKLTSTDLN